MVTRLLVAGVALVLGLAACSGSGEENTDATPTSSLSDAADSSTSTTATSTTTVPRSTTVAAPIVSAEIQSLVEDVIAEWNSGDTERWRATFAPEAFTRIAGDEYPIEILQDQNEFFWALGNQLALIGCAPADVGDAVVCDVEATDRFGDYLGLPPTQAELRFDFVDGLIVRYQDHFEGANSVRAAWVEFSGWIAERNPEDADAMRAFPGDAAGAQIALGYMDEYFETG